MIPRRATWTFLTTLLAVGCAEDPTGSREPVDGGGGTEPGDPPDAEVRDSSSCEEASVDAGEEDSGPTLGQVASCVDRECRASGAECGPLPGKDCFGSPIDCGGCGTTGFCGYDGRSGKCGRQCLSAYASLCSHVPGAPSAWGVPGTCSGTPFTTNDDGSLKARRPSPVGNESGCILASIGGASYWCCP